MVDCKGNPATPPTIVKVICFHCILCCVQEQLFSGSECAAKFFLYFTVMDYLQLRSYDNYITASITLARLDEEGITCYLKDEYTVTIDPFLSNAIGGIKLMVLPDDFEEASALLAGFDKDYRDAIVCPKCGSHNVEYINKT